MRALDQPDSAAGLARRLGVPRQKLNYHLRLLEDDGLVDRLLSDDGFVEKLVVEGGTLDQLVALGATLERIMPRLVELIELIPELHESVDTLNRSVGPLGDLANRIPGGKRRPALEA